MQNRLQFQRRMRSLELIEMKMTLTFVRFRPCRPLATPSNPFQQNRLRNGSLLVGRKQNRLQLTQTVRSLELIDFKMTLTSVRFRPCTPMATPSNIIGFAMVLSW